MKWRTEKVGDTREVKRFAWFPVELTSGQTIWFEKYVTRETLERGLIPSVSATCGYPVYGPMWVKKEAVQ